MPAQESEHTVAPISIPIPFVLLQELSNILWSFAKLGVRPDASWMQGWLLAMQPRMSR